ncbi:MAG: hypothetical protein LUE27_06765 [Clostridia bacterium]|nr:hypothetical protein [Clostridia bacterium]
METNMAVCEIQYGYANQYCVWFAHAYVIMPEEKAKHLEELFNDGNEYNDEVYLEVFRLLKKELRDSGIDREESPTPCYVDGIDSFKILRSQKDMEVLLEGKGELTRMTF